MEESKDSTVCGEVALRRVIEQHDQLVISKAILDELLGILARKFSPDAEELATSRCFCRIFATTVKPRRRLQIVKDEPDNRILECALAGRVEVIVTGDHALPALREYKAVRIIGLRDYLEQ